MKLGWKVKKVDQDHLCTCLNKHSIMPKMLIVFWDTSTKVNSSVHWSAHWAAGQSVSALILANNGLPKRKPLRYTLGDGVKALNVSCSPGLKRKMRSSGDEGEDRTLHKLKVHGKKMWHWEKWEKIENSFNYSWPIQ